MSVSQSFLPQVLQGQSQANRTSSPAHSSEEIDKHPEVPYEPLSISEPGEEEVQLGESQGAEGNSDMGLKEGYQRPERRSGDAVAKLAALVSVSIIVVTSWVMGLFNPPYSWFTWHPLLQTLGIAMFTYGVLTLQPTSQPKTKAAGLLRHQLAMITLGFPTFILGTLAVVYTKSINDKPHFQSWHGLIGIITMALGLCQVLLGAGSVWFNGWLFGGNPKAKFVWKYHRLSGYIVFPLFLLSIYLGGAWSHWSERNSIYIIRLVVFSICPVVVLVAVLARVRTSKMKFF